MKPIRITPANIPALAHFDGTRYYCLEWDCYTDRAQLTECGALPSMGSYYTPILRCSECGRLYFGKPTPLTDDGVIKEREEERNAIIRADEEATHTEIKRANEEQRATESAAIENHEAEQSGDIILPHLLTV